MERRWLTVKETAEYLGVHEKSLYRACLKGQIPSVKTPGLGRRVDKIKLDALLERRSLGPIDVGQSIK